MTGVPGAGGLTAAELAEVAAELGEELPGAVVRDAVVAGPQRDLVLFLDGPAPHGRRALHLALGAARARLCSSRARFPPEGFQQDAGAQRAREALAGARVEGLAAVQGERRCTVGLRAAQGEALRVEGELFGPRGNWAVVDEAGMVRAVAFLVRGRARRLEAGAPYVPPPAPPPPGPGPGSDPPTGSRFSGGAGALGSRSQRVDTHFRGVDEALAREQERERLRQALQKARRRAAARLASLEEALAAAGRVEELRRDAGLLLAHLHLLRRGMAQVELPDLHATAPALRAIVLDPRRDGRENAQVLFEKARRLEASRARTVADRDRTEGHLRALEALEEELVRAAEEGGGIEDLRRRAGPFLPRPRAAPAAPAARRRARPAHRSFVSAEGYPILVGRDAAGGVELTFRLARGNDLWLHAGHGSAGAHVVVRLPRGKTASLETLLDAAHLAVHFSKARGRPVWEVVTTQAKHVRRARGAKPGQVLVERSRPLTVRLDPIRLRRVLDTGGEGGGDLAPAGPRG